MKAALIVPQLSDDSETNFVTIEGMAANAVAADADPDIYCQGTELPMARTPFGTVAFLLCGDLFDDTIVSRFLALDADWLLYPFARCFSDGTVNQTRWDTQEFPEYVQRVKMAQTTALMVNYLADDSLHDDNSFGGAFMVSAAGEVLARHPLGKEGILIVDLKNNSIKASSGKLYS
jgi:N-carbamoylputrescine amidase